MLTNAQTYNDEDSQIYEEAGMLRRAFHQEMVRQFPGQPLPRPFSVYESCDEPMWVRPSGWVAPTSDADVEDEPDPFEALDWETAQAEDDEERAVARAIKAGGAVYANNPDTLADVARRFGRPGPGRPPTGRPVGRPRKNPIEPVGKVDDDAEFDPKRPNGPRPSSRHGGGGGGGGGNKRKPGGVELSALAAAARAALEAAGGESLTLDDLVAAAEKAKVPGDCGGASTRVHRPLRPSPASGRFLGGAHGRRGEVHAQPAAGRRRGGRRVPRSGANLRAREAAEEVSTSPTRTISTT